MTDYNKDETGENAEDTGVTKPENSGDSAENRRASRRRFLTGGAAAAPVIMTLSSRPALATTCGLLSGGSVNDSRPGDQSTCHGYGCSHWMAYKGYWKDRYPTWKKCSWMMGCYIPGGDPTLWSALSAGGFHGHCVSAVLNAWWMPGDYGYTEYEIKDKIHQHISEGRASDLYAALLQMHTS